MFIRGVTSGIVIGVSAGNPSSFTSPRSDGWGAAMMSEA